MLSDKKLYISTFVILIGLAGIFSGLSVLAQEIFVLEEIFNLNIINGNTFLPAPTPPKPKVIQTIEVIVTSYSSTVDQTDDTPFITASGELVRDGIIANNLLAFDTAVRMPEIFGDKIFIVKDRMHSRKGDYHFDIWFPTTEQAKEFGAQTTFLEILAN